MGEEIIKRDEHSCYVERLENIYLPSKARCELNRVMYRPWAARNGVSGFKFRTFLLAEA